MFVDGIAFVCFYAERVVCAIAKFLVHLLGEGEGRAWESGENGEGMEVREMGIHKNSPKRNRLGIWGRLLPVSYTFRKLFSGQHLHCS